MIALFWLIVIGLLIGAIRLPASLDIYINDTYVVVSRCSLIVLSFVARIVPGSSSRSQ